MTAIKIFTAEVWIAPEDRMRALVQKQWCPTEAEIPRKPKEILRIYGHEADIFANHLGICTAANTECLLVGDQVRTLQQYLSQQSSPQYPKFRDATRLLHDALDGPVRVRFRMQHIRYPATRR